MTVHLTQHRGGFGPGTTPITRFDEAEDNTGIELSVHKLAAGEEHAQVEEWETAWLLMSGEATVEVGDREARFRRRSLFDESACCVHLAAGGSVRIRCSSEAEFTVFRTANRKRFQARVFQPADVSNEHRGAGQMGGACLRFVRTIFDATNSDANADLVLGEVVTLPGRWSSYPPHHHPQPEIYHYRFTRPEGFGFAQLGENVVRVRPYDTVKIFPPQDHSQCAAPGYGMYYAWVIRHLPGNRYGVPEFTPEHRWTMERGAPFWQPAELERHG